MIPRCDLHIHTTFCDGIHTPEEMVLAAVRQNYETIGFSGHAPTEVLWDMDWCIQEENMVNYVCEIQRLKQKYKNSIHILLGLELDYYSPKPSVELDYTIGSVHYIKCNQEYISVDDHATAFKQAVERCYSGNVWLLIRDFYDTTSKIVEKTNCNIVGHFDLITKFNEKHAFFNEEDFLYRNLALSALDCILKKDVWIEINTGAMSRGWRSMPYPAPFIMKRIAEKKGKMVINSDAHSLESIGYAFDDTIEYARSCGLREIWTYQNDRFIPTLI